MWLEGVNPIQFHGSFDEFDHIDFSASKDIGFHVGNLLAALYKVDFNPKQFKYARDSFIYVVEVRPNVEDTLVINDVFSYDNNCFRRLYNEIMDVSIKANLESLSKDLWVHRGIWKTFEELRYALMRNGIHYIQYMNTQECVGLSYCILDPNVRMHRYHTMELLNKIPFI